MAQRRLLVLDEDSLIMVVDKDIVRQLDEHRGELTRTEFVNFLIHNQLREADRGQNYVDKEDFHQAVSEIKELMRNFLDFILTLELAKDAEDSDFKEWRRKIQSLHSLNS